MYLHLAAALVVTTTTAPMRAHTSAPVVPDARTTAVNVDPATVSELLARAATAEETGRLGEARRIYRKLISDQEADGQYAGLVLWRLALNHFNDNDRWNAAQTFDKLALAANQFGDPTMELRATFEGAALWLQLKRRDQVAPHMERVKALLQSPAISEETKSQIKARM